VTDQPNPLRACTLCGTDIILSERQRIDASEPHARAVTVCPDCRSDLRQRPRRVGRSRKEA
jgi:hypothetical protein